MRKKKYLIQLNKMAGTTKPRKALGFKQDNVFTAHFLKSPNRNKQQLAIFFKKGQTLLKDASKPD